MLHSGNLTASAIFCAGPQCCDPIALYSSTIVIAFFGGVCPYIWGGRHHLASSPWALNDLVPALLTKNSHETLFSQAFSDPTDCSQLKKIGQCPIWPIFLFFQVSTLCSPHYCSNNMRTRRDGFSLSHIPTEKWGEYGLRDIGQHPNISMQLFLWGNTYLKSPRTLSSGILLSPGHCNQYAVICII